MLWKIYTVLFFVINAVSLIVFDYQYFSVIPFLSLVLSVGLNIAVFSYAFRKPIFTRQILDWLFKLNIGLFGVFLLFEVITFFQEILGAGINLPTSGVVAIVASTPALPALYATYKMAYQKTSESKKSKRRK